MEKDKKVFCWDENTDKVELSEYTHIRAYHGCRTLNVESYIKEGIHSFSRKQAYKIVHDILLQCGIEEKEILKCFNKKWNDDMDHFDKVCVNFQKKICCIYQMEVSLYVECVRIYFANTN